MAAKRFARSLGLPVPDDRQGCLQDVHWAMGAFGYFPSYSVGNLYAAQMWEAAEQSMPDLPEQIRRDERRGGVQAAEDLRTSAAG